MQLRAQGIEVVRCGEVGLAESDDVELLEYATSQGCTLVSHDLDFVQLHSQWLHDGQRHCGIVVFNRKFQGNVGKLVTELVEWHRLIAEGAGAVESDVYNRLIEIVR